MTVNKFETLMNDICDMITQGNTLRSICKIIEMTEVSFQLWINKPEFSARITEARINSAAFIYDKGEQVLLDAPSDMVEISRARELAQHYRKKAGVMNPKKYGDKIQHSGDSDGDPIKIVTGMIIS